MKRFFIISILFVSCMTVYAQEQYPVNFINRLWLCAPTSYSGETDNGNIERQVTGWKDELCKFSEVSGQKKYNCKFSRAQINEIVSAMRSGDAEEILTKYKEDSQICTPD